MAGFDEVVTAASLDDAAQALVDALGEETTGIWVTTRGGRRFVAGTEVSDVPTASASGLCQAVIEVRSTADPRLVDAAAVLLAGVADRCEIADRARRARRRLTDSERIGALGTYAWEMATDELEWTEGLFRIYGRDPASFEPSYDGFLAHLHPDDRDRVRAIHERSLRTGEPFEMEERIVRPDGETRTLWSIGEVSTDDAGHPTGIVGVCRDVTEQRHAEQRVADADLRRRQALELNDNVIQGLVSLLWQLGEADEDARSTAEATLAAARRMVADLLRDAEDGDTGHLVRRDPVDLEPPAVPLRVAQAVPGSVGASSDGRGAVSAAARVTVLIADDLPALRTLIRLQLSRREGIEVVGEAGDGEEAVDLAQRLRPDVVVMDLSMPRLDGLEATRRIRELVPTTRVIVLSGYPEASMAEDVRAAGAQCYVEKSSDLELLCTAILATESPRDAVS